MSEIKTNKISPRKGTTQTIGDSGDTVSIPCGVTTTNAGTISTGGITGGTIDNQGTITGLQQVIEWDTTAKTANFNADVQSGYFVNTTSGAITVTFPASPTAGDVIALKDYANTFDTNNLTIDANGNKIQGSTENFIVSVEGSSVQLIYVDATRGWVLTDASKASDIAESATFICATGGCISTCGDFKIHTFTGPGTFCVSQTANPAGGPNAVDYLVVAGGGSGAGQWPGADTGGGGGAGGYRTSFPSCGAGSIPVSVQGYPIVVGGGGAGETVVGQPGNGNDGSCSSFSTITSAGGGKGGGGLTAGANANSGGSGGGGSRLGTSGSGNTPPVSPPQGNAGSNGINGPGDSDFGGGGGGAASAATNQNGGAGSSNSITGSSVAYAGGGGGAGRIASGGSGGTGGGGAGAGPRSGPNTGGNGTINTGGGGGGAGSSPTSPASIGIPGSGGSGIVVIRYKYQ